MPLVQVVVGNKVAAADVNQIVQALTGSAAHPITLFGSYTAGTYPFTVWNTEAGGLLGLFKTNAGNILKVTKDGVRLSPDGAQFDLIPLTTAAVQSMTNKSIDGSLNTLTNIPGAAHVANSIPEAAYLALSGSTRMLANDVITGAKLGIVEGAMARRSSNFSISNASRTVVEWNAEDWDTNAIHDMSTTNLSKRLTCKISGLYEVITGIYIDASSNFDDRDITLKKNGVDAQLLMRNSPGTEWSVYGTTGGTYHTWIRLVATDYLELAVLQKSSGSRNITNDSFFGMRRIGA